MRTSATERFRRADAIFDAALDLADAERTAYVERACGDDAALRAEVLGLLGAHRSAGDLLDGALVPRAAGRASRTTRSRASRARRRRASARSASCARSGAAGWGASSWPSAPTGSSSSASRSS
jgi:hypothetical protein